MYSKYRLLSVWRSITLGGVVNVALLYALGLMILSGECKIPFSVFMVLFVQCLVWHSVPWWSMGVCAYLSSCVSCLYHCGYKASIWYIELANSCVPSSYFVLAR